MTIRNIPISCKKCQTPVYGQEYPITESNGRKVINCVWRCGRCGSFNKQGITRIISEPK